MISNTHIDRVTECDVPGLTVIEYVNWNSYTHTHIANKISRTLGAMNSLKPYLPMSHLFFRIFNLELKTGAAIAYQNCKHGPFGLW